MKGRAVRCIVVLCLVFGLVGVVSAEKPRVELGSEALVPFPGAGSVGEAVRVIDSHGFEAAEGYSLGPLNGQVGWTTFAANPDIPIVWNTNPATGAQHIVLSGDPAAGSGTYLGGFSPDLGAVPVDVGEVTVNVFISAGGGANYLVNAQAPSQGLTTWRVEYDWNGNIFISNDLGSGFEMVDTGVPWVPGVYHALRVVVDPVGNTIDYFIDGSPLYSGVLPGGTAVEQVVLLHDNWNIDDYGLFDDLYINTEYPVNLQSFSVE